MSTYQSSGEEPTGVATAEAGDRPGAGEAPTTAERFRLSGTDLDEACARYQEIWGGRDFRGEPVGSSFSYRYASAGDERMTLRTSTFSGRIGGEVPWLGEYVVSWFREGSGAVQHRRGRQASRASDPFTLPPELPFDLAVEPHVLNLVHVAPGFLEDTATELHGGPSQLVVFDHTAEPQPAAVETWRRAVSVATPAVVDPEGSPLLRLDAQLLLARAMLQLVPWRPMDVPRAVRAERGGKLRDAVDFVHEHAHEPITPADVARAAGMHTRTLQQLLSSRLGTSPAAYVRQVRLDRVEAELVRSRPGEVRVSEVATRWGFGNLGRFSAAYAARFGEQPRETLARQRGTDGRKVSGAGAKADS
jgi:AraC-like DNA-binding protein